MPSSRPATPGAEPANLLDLTRPELAKMTAYSVPHLPAVRAKLDANESPWPLPPEVAAALGAHLADVALHRYPDGGADALRAVLAAELGCAPGELILGNGSDELIGLLVATFARPRPGE